MFKVPEKCRIRTSLFGPIQIDECNGVFNLKYETKDRTIDIYCIASNGDAWERVSVTIPGNRRCPTWDEMCFVKSIFWSKNDTVIQYHPKESDYINCHKFCLHLWNPIVEKLPLPPTYMVGPV